MRARNIALLVGVSVSVLWFTLIASFLYYQHPNQNVIASLLNMGWNEIGDALAGMFAPLAFFWLVIAVFVQSSELKAQREELSLTREEMELARKIKEEEVNEARQSAEFIGKQTEILKREEEKNAVTFHDDQLNELIELVSIFLQRVNYVAVAINTESEPEARQIFEFEKQSSTEVAISSYLNLKFTISEFLISNHWEGEQIFDIFCGNVEVFAELQSILSSISSLEALLSPSGKIVFQRYHLYKIPEHLDFFKKIMELKVDDYRQFAQQAEHLNAKREYLFSYQTS